MAGQIPGGKPVSKKPDDPLKAGKAKLWAALRQLTGAEPTVGAAEKLLRERNILGEAETLGGLDSAQLAFATEKIEILIQESTPS